MNEILPTVDQGLPVEVVVVGVSSLTAVAVAVITSVTNKDRRARLLSDLEILNRLETGSEAHRLLKASIDRRVIATSDTGAKTRNWFSVILGILFLVVGIAVLSIVNSLGGLWLILHVFTVGLILFGIVGVITGAKKVPRDDKGNEIRDR